MRQGGIETSDDRCAETACAVTRTFFFLKGKFKCRPAAISAQLWRL